MINSLCGELVGYIILIANPAIAGGGNLIIGFDLGMAFLR